MWEAISDVFVSSNASYILVTVFALAVLLGIFAKLGIVSVHRKGVRFGKNTALMERVVIKKQIEYVQKYCLALEGQIARLFEKKSIARGAKEYFYKYLACLVSNEVEKWVLDNNVSMAAAYVQAKQMELRTFLLAQVGACEFNEANLTKKVNFWVEDILRHVMFMRRNNALG